MGRIETDISEQVMEELIYVVYDKRIGSLEQSQLPAKGTFESKDAIGKVTGTLLPDWEKNKEIFWGLLK